jgi:glycosyltransferase involved in cell wall biosynthesis
MNILFLTDKIEYVSGVSKHLYYLSDELLKHTEDKIYIMCSGGDMKEEFIKSGANVIEYPRMLFDNRSGVNFLISLIYIIRFCIENKISIIHSHTHYTANLGYFASKFLMIRSVQTIHGLFPDEGRLPHFRADLYIALNNKIINYMVQLGIKPGKISLIRQGIPVYSGPVKKNRPLKVFCASRLIYDKGVDIFIRSAAKIAGQLNTETEFIVAGEGAYEKDLQNLSEEKGVKIKFVGKLNNLNNALVESSVFVFPSRIKTEGFPVSLIEAGMYANLVITSNFESLTEVAESTKDCIIFYNDDYEDLAGKLLFAINNYSNLIIIAESWRKKCLQNFTSVIMAEKTRDVYLKGKVKGKK